MPNEAQTREASGQKHIKTSANPFNQMTGGQSVHIVTIEHLDTVVSDVTDKRVTGHGLHGLRRVLAQQIDRRLSVEVETALPVALRQDDGHAVVDWRYDFIRFGGDDSEALQLGSAGTLPGVPDTGEG